MSLMANAAIHSDRGNKISFAQKAFVQFGNFVHFCDPFIFH